MAFTSLSDIPSFKVCLLGEGAVGKTSLVLQYVEGKFPGIHQATIQAAYFDKLVNIEGRRLKLAIWDTAGQERFHALGPIYYRDSRAALLVYDITDRDSFERVKNWVRELRQVLGSDVLLFIVGNKTDLEADRKVTLDEAMNYARTVGAQHFQTSARLNRGVDELFLQISKAILVEANTDSKKTSHQGGGNLLIIDDTKALPRRRTCCT